ncbi:DNA breaking-rejoining enzyme [Suillus plorans]|uniref:DNA breaking-rejoining enzyme n=1 Tax=Suillus plorans TaxID=116603 RepID=A0A9P7DQX5_9AGAM|nr:DNA breaking-rejoining enzyme [Suillus plorans]KAG1800902.1 DNA breaking-rejoining enzyme [Suillus plorans]
MDACDSVKLDGTNKPSTNERGLYSHAQKMRAAMTYTFGRLQGLGNLPWHESELHSGQMLGNPSVSVEVSSYMCSLRRCKVQAGEVAVSAHAITSHILKRMYHFNHRPENWAILDYRPGGRGDSSSESSHWAGGRIRRCLHAAYTIAFLCMLRSDEVLKIQLHDLHFFSNGLVLTLPFRKTHQNSDIKPFWLWIMPTEAHLCAVQAIAEWIMASRIVTGYLFRKFASGDRIAEANQPLTSERFLELFRNNLLDIGVDPSSYGTHSFRRGGCQYLHIERQWLLHRICEWGSWSLEFTNLTIVKYLISHNDDATEPHEHFFNPDRSPSVKCPHCGRSCPCA